MARPKTKLWEGSTEIFPIAKLRIPPSNQKMVIVTEAAVAPAYLALCRTTQAFVNRHAKAIEQIKQHFDTTAGSGDIVNLILVSFWDIIVRPELVLKPDKRTPNRLAAFLAAFPGFTLEYLGTLNRAWVKHQRKEFAFQRAVIALSQRKAIVSSYGKPLKFEDATDLEICAALKVSPAIYKKAKRYLTVLRE